MKQIDERGNACPIPVVHTKKALESMGGETKLIVLVDNEPAVQNVTRFAEGKNCEVKSEKISDNEFKIEIMAESIHRQMRKKRLSVHHLQRMILSSLYHPTRWDKERKLLVRH